MLRHVGGTVTALHRDAFGGLADPELLPGETRPLHAAECLQIPQMLPLDRVSRTAQGCPAWRASPPSSGAAPKSVAHQAAAPDQAVATLSQAPAPATASTRAGPSQILRPPPAAPGTAQGPLRDRCRCRPCTLGQPHRYGVASLDHVSRMAPRCPPPHAPRAPLANLPDGWGRPVGAPMQRASPAVATSWVWPPQPPVFDHVPWQTA